MTSLVYTTQKYITTTKKAYFSTKKFEESQNINWSTCDMGLTRINLMMW